jgi:hypothetical protein
MTVWRCIVEIDTKSEVEGGPSEEDVRAELQYSGLLGDQKVQIKFLEAFASVADLERADSRESFPTPK